MKKKLLSLILSISLVLGLLPVSAAGITFPSNPVGPQAGDQVQYEVTGSGTRQYGPFEKAWNAIAQSKKGGSLKLIRNVTAQNGSFGKGTGFDSGGGLIVPGSKTVVLDLNGYALDRGLQTARENGGVLTVRGTLTVKDSRSGGTIKGGNTTANGGGVTVSSTGALNLQSGTITGNTAQQGGGVYNLGVFSMSGGAVTKNMGGGIHQGRLLTVSGTAKITENQTPAEGSFANIYLPAGKTFTAKDLKAGAQIGITSETLPTDAGTVTVATGSIPEYDLSKFTSDAGYQVVLEDAKLLLKGNAPADTSHIPGQTTTAAVPQQPQQTGPAQTTQDGSAEQHPETCTVIFSPQGGVLRTNEETRKKVPYNTVLGALPVPTREGYTFEGWYTTASDPEPAAPDGETSTAANGETPTAATGETTTAVTSETPAAATGETATAANGETATDGEVPAETVGVLVTENMLVTADMTVYARWKAVEVEISFRLNGGEGEQPEDITVEYDKMYGACVSGEFPEDPERSGYGFTGWYTRQTGGDLVTAATIVKTTKKQILYAQWEAGRYNVTLDENYEEEGSQTYEHPVAFQRTYGTIRPLRTPVRQGYDFSGWFTEDEKRVRDSTKVTEEEEHTLYAHWKLKEVLVTFDRNYEGASAAAKVRIPYGATYGEGFRDEQLPEPTRKGYEFLGWYTKAIDGEEITASDIMEQETPHTLYAHWESVGERQVTFDPNGGAGSPVVLVTAPTGALELPTVESCKFTAPENMTFDRWAISSLEGRKVQAGVSVNFEEDTTVYALWKSLPMQETVTFDPNGGTLNGAASKTVTVGSAYGTLPQAVWEGYSFEGWYTAPADGARVTSASKVVMEGDHTLYAHWKEDEIVALMEEEEPQDDTPTETTPTAQAQYTPLDGEAVTGTFEDMWNLAARDRTGTVKLLQNVTADESGWFGSGAGFDPRGAVLGHEALEATLDLNGKTLSRNNPQNIANGYVITNYGLLTITDTSSEGTGVVTMGHSTTVDSDEDTVLPGNGGGVLNFGTLTVDGAAITGNIAESGGGVYNGEAYSLTGSIHVSGNARINGNRSDDALLLQPIVIDSPLGEQARIGVAVSGTPEEGTAVAVQANPGDVGKFYSNHVGFIVAEKDDDPTILVLKSAETCTVTFDPLGGTVSPASKTVTVGGVYGSLPIPAREGYVFGGWYTAETDGTHVTESTQVTTGTDHTLYAVWGEEPAGPACIVTFDPNGEDATVAPIQKTYGINKPYTDLPTPKREGYTFIGWFTEASGGTQVTTETLVTNTANHTLYAHWGTAAATLYTITYNANGGEGTMDSHTVEAGKAFTMRGCGFTPPSGKVFDRWAIGSADSSDTVLAGAPYTFTADTTVYALWRDRPTSSIGSGSSGSSGSPAYHPVRPRPDYSASSSDEDDEDDEYTSTSTNTNSNTNTNDNTSSETPAATEYIRISASAGTGGSIAPIGEVRVSRGSEQSFDISADDGYEVSDVLIDGTSIGVVFRYTFEKVQREHSIEAVFTPSGSTQQGSGAAQQSGGNTPQSTTTSGGSVNYLVCMKDASCPITPYVDIQPTGWYHDGVHYCIDNGLMSGVDETHFDPTAPLTRGMLAQILYNYEGQPLVSDSDSGFIDVVNGMWYEDAVKRAVESGIVAGYEDGSYGPNDPITREQIVVVLWRHAGSPVSGNTVPLSDFSQTREYADEAMRWAFGRGIISGKDNGLLDPSGQASRAEVAQMLKSYLDSLL